MNIIEIKKVIDDYIVYTSNTTSECIQTGICYHNTTTQNEI
jgi:hypothetical protein